MKTNKIVFLLIIILNTLLFSCTNKEQYFETAGSLHTPYHIKYQYTRSLDKEIQVELKRYYHSINPFDSLSIISQVNQNKEVEVDTLFVDVFNKAMEISEKTDGIFDVTCGPLINLWGFGFSKKDSVTPHNIDSIRSFVGFRKVRLDGRRVTKEDPRIIMNFSALGDGCSCDVVAALLDSKGIENYMIEIGGEVLAKGINPKGECWRIGINKPSDDPAGINQELEVIAHLCGRVGLATSGNYRNFYEKDGKKYGHTINPITGYPAEQDILSATIIAPDCITADGYATAFMALGSEKARELKKKVPEIEYFIIYTDAEGKYRTEHSEGFSRYLSK
ncbi:MAG: FAD:protein FMN transferase [Porphyromonadaceae bacterium]|nr:FAD:protein FMN transferase [Porphyromonadaceae bacterium]